MSPACRDNLQICHPRHYRRAIVSQQQQKKTDRVQHHDSGPSRETRRDLDHFVSAINFTLARQESPEPKGADRASGGREEPVPSQAHKNIDIHSGHNTLAHFVPLPNPPRWCSILGYAPPCGLRHESALSRWNVLRRRRRPERKKINDPRYRDT